MNSQIWQLNRQWIVNQPDTEPRQLGTNELSSYRSIILLGSAGAGKTIETRRLADFDSAAGKDVRECRLAEYAGSVDELSRRLSELAHDVNENTVLYLDALDEAMIPLKRAGLVIRNWIDQTLLGSDAALRITCRSAVWPDLLSAKMQELAGSGDFAYATLQALNDSDIVTAAESMKVDSSAFLVEINSRRAKALATQPLTLHMLLRLYTDSHGLPSSLHELFEIGLSKLAADRYERFEIGTNLSVDPQNLISQAERLACYSVLTGRDTFDLSDDPPTDYLGWSELASLNDGDRPLDRETLRTIGSSGLCDSMSAASFRFTHRQFAEYLAGQRLARLLPHQAKSLLASPAGWKSGVAGPLRETAAFAAMASPEIATWLADCDPEVVGLSDVANHDLRKTAMLGLLDRFRNGQLTDAQIGQGELELRGFRYSNAEVDLRPVLQERGDHCEDVLECAIELINSWHLETMSDDLADLVLDPTAPLHARKAAGYALLKFGSSESRERLKPLISSASKDEHHELKGLALRCNWPNQLSTSELLSALTPLPDSSYHGAYYGFFLELDRERFYAKGYLAEGLRWAKMQFSTLGDSDPAQRITKRIVHAAVFELDDRSVLKDMANSLSF